MNNEQTNPVLSADDEGNAASDTAGASPKLAPALLAGAAAAVIGAVLWAVVTVATKYQIGWMAVGVGFLVGIAVRKAGRAGSPRQAMIAAVLALLGCGLGNLLSACGFVAQQDSVGFWQVLGQLTPDIAIKLLQVTFSPMDILFYGIAIYQAYKLAA